MKTNIPSRLICACLIVLQMSQNLASSTHPSTEIQYVPYPLQPRTYLPYSSQHINQQLPQQRTSAQFGRTDPFGQSLCVSSIVVPGLQGKHAAIGIWRRCMMRYTWTVILAKCQIEDMHTELLIRGSI